MNQSRVGGFNTESKALEVLHELRKNFPKTFYRIVKVTHQVMDV
jgi:hypothetical protein